MRFGILGPLAVTTDDGERLAEELGLDPGPELAALYRQILEQDPGLRAQPRAAIVRSGLPAQLDELIGRAEALTELRALIPAGRLLTLVGPGGVGKTRLAVAAAAEQVQPDGVHLMELAPLAPAETRVAERALGVLGLHEAPGTAGSAADRLVAALRHREMLLVLDNCEHVVAAAAALVGRLLRDAPGVRVLATSREPLLLAGERIWEVGPLALPSDPGDVDAVRRSAAARLFAARAAAQHRGFRLDEQTAPAVAQLCRRLDGLPLALELAATRVRALGVQGVVDRLDDRFRLLTTRQRDVPERQRTLAHGGGLRLALALTWYWVLRGRLSEARAALAQAGTAEEERLAAPWRLGLAGAPTAVVFAEMSLGIAARRSGRLEQAVTHLTRIADRGRIEPQPPPYLPMILVELGYAHELRGDPSAARALHMEAYGAAIGSARDGIGAVEGMAAVAEPAAAARLLGAAATARDQNSVPAAPAEQDDLDRAARRAVAALGRERFDDLVAEGAKVTLDQAVAFGR